MPTNITIKNIPDPLYQRLKEAAEIHHRSINSEVIACLERVLFPLRMSAEERLERAHVLRQDITQYGFKADEIDDAIEQGRP
jgi:antitoxin FitA